MSYDYDPDDYAEDPYANPYGMDEQTMIDFLVANGAGAGMLPMVQPGTGKALTVANRTSALNANRSALFDTAFQGLGGAQAFAPGAFEPTVSTSIKQTPELQQVYGYLRSPTSMEGIMAQEMMTGGTPATARRALQQLLTATPEEVAAVFAGYDQFFGRQPTVTVDDVDRIRTNLLLELPARTDRMTGDPLPKEADGTGVDWDGSEFSVDARANTIGELQAAIPRVGPSAPQWGVDPNTGQPMQISAGGELQWGTDETGAPVLMETTVTESEAAKTFSDLGLPTPADEYTAESFMSPETNALFEALPQYDQTVQAAMAAMMDPSLAPTNRETMTPYREGFAPGGGSGGGGGGGSRPMTPEEQAAYALAKLTYDSNPIASAAGQAVEGVAGIPSALGLGPLAGVAQQIAGGGAPNPLVAGPLSAVAGGGWRGADELAQAAMSGLGSLFGSSDPQAAAAQPPADPDQAAMIAALIQQAAQGNQSVDLDPGGLLAGGSWAGEGVNVDELMRRRAAGYAPAEQPPPVPGPDDYAAGDPATYEEFLAQQAATNPSPGVGAASGNPFAINLAPAPYVEGGPIPPATINGQPNPAYQDYLDTLLPGQFRQPRVGAPPPSETAPWTTPQPPPPGIGAASGSPFAINTARSPLAGPPQGGLPQSEQALTAPYRGGTAAPQSEQAITATPQITAAMIAAMLGGNAPTAPQGGLPQSEQAGRGTQVRGRTPTTAPQSEQTIQRQAMQRYQFPEIATGEQSARYRQQQADEQNAQILGGSTDRTGQRVRPTRTGEQARAFRAAMDTWHSALDQRNQARQATWGSAEFGQGVAQEIQMRRAGVRPLDQALMARRLVLMNAGMPQGV